MIAAGLWLVTLLGCPQLGFVLCEKLQNNISIKSFNLPGNDWNIAQKNFCANLLGSHKVISGCNKDQGQFCGCYYGNFHLTDVDEMMMIDCNMIKV